MHLPFSLWGRCCCNWQQLADRLRSCGFLPAFRGGGSVEDAAEERDPLALMRRIARIFSRIFRTSLAYCSRKSLIPSSESSDSGMVVPGSSYSWSGSKAIRGMPLSDPDRCWRSSPWQRSVFVHGRGFSVFRVTLLALFFVAKLDNLEWMTEMILLYCFRMHCFVFHSKMD